MCEAEVSIWINTQLTADFFVGCDYVFVVSLYLNVGSSGKADTLSIPPISYSIRLIVK